MRSHNCFAAALSNGGAWVRSLAGLQNPESTQKDSPEPEALKRAQTTTILLRGMLFHVQKTTTLLKGVLSNVEELEGQVLLNIALEELKARRVMAQNPPKGHGFTIFFGFGWRLSNDPKLVVLRPYP